MCWLRTLSEAMCWLRTLRQEVKVHFHCFKYLSGWCRPFCWTWGHVGHTNNMMDHFQTLLLSRPSAKASMQQCNITTRLRLIDGCKNINQRSRIDRIRIDHQTVLRYYMVEGSLEVKFPTIWTHEKQRWEKSERREELKREDQRRERVRRKKMQTREKVGKSRNTVFFQWFVAPEGRKVGSLKRRVRGHLARWEMKIARRCGAKRISKSKCTKHTRLGPLLEVEMLKKCTPLWREAHFEVKSAKTDGYRALLDVQMCFRVAGARDCAPSQTWAKREGFVAFPKTMAGVGHLKRICKDAFSVAGAVQETCSSEMLEVRALISWEGLHFGASDL